MYLIIYRYEDELSVEYKSREEMLAWLAEDGDNFDFVDMLPEGCPERWPPRTAFIVKGEAVVPKAVAVTVRHEID